MDSGSSSNSPAPFLIKTYEMIDDPLTNPIVSWSQSGCSFVVWNPPDFAQHLLPKYFKHNNFSSFVRQLNTYGFRKIDPDQWEFANEEFIRGQRHLLSNIRRRKPIHSHSLQNQIGNISPLTDPERKEYEDRIKKLKQEKTFLQLELHRNETEKRAFEGQIVSYSDRLQSMERRQMELVSFLSQLAKKPELESILMQQPDYNNKKRRLFESGDFNVDNSDEGSPSLMKLESVEKLDSSIKTLEEFLYGERENWCHQRNDFRLVEPSSPTIVRELSASSIDGETCSPRSNPSTPRSMDIPSSPELAVVANGNVESSLKSPEVESKSVQPGGANDHFWEYFLTEAPGIEEPEKRVDQSSDGVRRSSGVKDERDEKGWWNPSVIHDLTMHMEHLAPAGRT